MNPEAASSGRGMKVRGMELDHSFAGYSPVVRAGFLAFADVNVCATQATASQAGPACYRRVSAAARTHDIPPNRKQTILATLCLVGLAFGFARCDQSTPVPPASPGLDSPSTNSSAATPVHPELQKLKGRWERPDGGYIIEIRSVDAGGKLDATYSNPSPIKVSRAVAYRQGSETKVLIELTDVNYPGCLYQLVLDEQHDQLFGTYFQAAQQQTYDVTFARLK